MQRQSRPRFRAKQSDLRSAQDRNVARNKPLVRTERLAQQSASYFHGHAAPAQFRFTGVSQNSPSGKTHCFSHPSTPYRFHVVFMVVFKAAFVLLTSGGAFILVSALTNTCSAIHVGASCDVSHTQQQATNCPRTTAVLRKLAAQWQQMMGTLQRIEQEAASLQCLVNAVENIGRTRTDVTAGRIRFEGLRTTLPKELVRQHVNGCYAREVAAWLGCIDLNMRLAKLIQRITKGTLRTTEAWTDRSPC